MSHQQTLFGMADRLPRDERKDQIFELLNRVPWYLTAREIGAHIGLRKTPHLLSIINEMVHEGQVDFKWETMTNGLRVRVYFTPEEYKPNAS